jgi:hypothetical protein
MATNRNSTRRPGHIGSVKVNRERYGFKTAKAPATTTAPDPSQLYVINDELVKGSQIELVPVKAREPIVLTPHFISTDHTAINALTGQYYTLVSVEGTTDRGDLVSFEAELGKFDELKLVSKPRFA